MKLHVGKAKANGDQITEGQRGLRYQANRDSTCQFVDDRPESVTQRRLQKVATNSPQVSQLEAA